LPFIHFDTVVGTVYWGGRRRWAAAWLKARGREKFET